MQPNCNNLIEAYVQWLHQSIHLSASSEWCQITTPFLDRHNDAIQIYVEQKNGTLLLSDDGYTLRDLRSGGLELSTQKRRALLENILNGFGVRVEADELVTVATPQTFPQKKHSLVQAMLAVGDLFALSEPHVISLFKEDVRAFLEANEIQKFQDFKLTGKSGFDHKFDFALPKTRIRPERVLEVINDLTKNQTTNLAWAVSDVKAVREDTLEVLVFLNDVENPPPPDNISALQAYDIKPLLWSERNTVLPLLNGSTKLS